MYRHALGGLCSLALHVFCNIYLLLYIELKKRFELVMTQEQPPHRFAALWPTKRGVCWFSHLVTLEVNVNYDIMAGVKQ